MFRRTCVARRALGISNSFSEWPLSGERGSASTQAWAARPRTLAPARSPSPGRQVMRARPRLSRDVPFDPYAPGPAREPAIIVHARSPHESLSDHPLEPPTGVGRHRMALVQRRRLHREARLRIPDHQIGIVPGCDAALASLEPREARWAGGEPAGEVGRLSAMSP